MMMAAPWFSGMRRDRALMNAISQSHAMAHFDRDGRIRSANAIFLDLMGCTLDQIRGEHHRILVVSRDVV